MKMPMEMSALLTTSNAGFKKRKSTSAVQCTVPCAVQYGIVYCTHVQQYLPARRRHPCKTPNFYVIFCFPPTVKPQPSSIPLDNAIRVQPFTCTHLQRPFVHVYADEVLCLYSTVRFVRPLYMCCTVQSYMRRTRMPCGTGTLIFRSLFSAGDEVSGCA